MTRVAALVVSYRSFDHIGPLIESIEAAKGPIHVDVHLIENSEDPGETARLRTLPGTTRVVDAGANLGYGGGVNALAIDILDDYDWLLVCNPDIRFRADSISALVDAAAELPDAGLFGPLIRTETGDVYPSARAFPSLRVGIGHAIFGAVWPSNPWTRRYHRAGRPGTRHESEVDWLSGACLLIRPGAFRQVDGFDANYFMYFEDVDLAYRLRQSGWAAAYVPTAEITHSGAHSTQSRAALMRAVHHQSARRYLDKKYSAWWLAPIRWVLAVGLWLRARLIRD